MRWRRKERKENLKPSVSFLNGGGGVRVLYLYPNGEDGWPIPGSAGVHASDGKSELAKEGGPTVPFTAMVKHCSETEK